MNDENVVQEGEGGAEISRTRRIPPNPARALMGKIARLPKAIREQVNRRLEDGQPTSVMVPWLNELPAVKKVMATYFGGAEINHRNISNWRATGYKRWVERQEILAEVKELAEEAADINATSADGLMRMTATLACTKLLQLLRGEKTSASDVVKIGFAIAALNNVELSRVRAEHEERRLEQKDELVTLAWDKHLRDCAAIALRVLNDAQAKAVQQAPINNEAKIELIGRRMFGKLWRGRKVGAGSTRGVGSTHGPMAGPDEGTNGTDETDGGGQSPPVLNSDEPSLHPEPINQSLADSAVNELALTPTLSPRRGGIVVQGLETSGDDNGSESQRQTNEGEQPQKNAKITKSGEARPDAGAEEQQKQTKETKIGGEGRPLTPALSPNGGEGEETDAAQRVPAMVQPEEKAFGEAPNVTREARVVPKPMLSDYEKAILEGKSSLEAMYAQFTPPKDPRPPRAPRPMETPPYYAMSRQPDPHLQRPPPEWNSLG